MTYLKCTFAGLGLAFVAVVVSIAALLLLPFGVGLIASSGSGGLGAVSLAMEPMLLAAIMGFALGFWLTLRRQRRKRVSKA